MRDKWSIAFEIVFPILCGGILMAIGENFSCDITNPEIDCNAEYKIY